MMLWLHVELVSHLVFIDQFINHNIYLSIYVFIQ